MARHHLGSHRFPSAQLTLADTYVHITLMDTGIQNMQHFWYNLQSCGFFFINGAVPVPMFGGPLELCVQDLWQYCLWSYYSAWLDTPITKPHLTFLSDVIPGLGLNSCNAPYVYNLADNKNVSMSNNDFVIWMLHMNQKPSRLQTSSRDQINNIRHVIWIAQVNSPHFITFNCWRY